MGKVLIDEETQIEISHSKFGAVSIITSFLLGAYISALYFITVQYNGLKFRNFDSDLVFEQALKFPLKISLYAAIFGIVLSIIGMMSKFTKKFYPLFGFLFNAWLLYFAFRFNEIMHLN